MSRVTVSIDIAAPPSRVWRALCDPIEVGQWDSGVEAAVDAPRDYPQPGQHVRWRCRSGRFRILHDRPQEVVPERSLRSLLSLGIVRYDETYTLEPTSTGAHLQVFLDVSVPIPVIGAVVTRLRATSDARAAFKASLANLKHWCETNPGPT